MNTPFDRPQGSLPRGSGMLIGAGVFGAVGLGIGIVAALMAYVPASPWELPAAFAPFLAGAGLARIGGRKFASPRDLGLNRYSGVLHLLLGACAVIVCVIVSSGLMYAAMADLIGNTTWAGLISLLPAAGPMGIFLHYQDIHTRNFQREMAEITAELDQEVQELMKAHEGDAPHDSDDAT